MKTISKAIFKWIDIKERDNVLINGTGYSCVDLTNMASTKNLFKFLRANSETIESLCIRKCKLNVLELHMIFSIVGEKLQELQMSNMIIYGPKNGRGMKKIEMSKLSTLFLDLEVAPDFEFIGSVIIAKNLKTLEYQRVRGVKPYKIRPDIRSIISAQKATMVKLILTNVAIDERLVDRLMILGIRHLVLKGCAFVGKQFCMTVNKSIKEVELVDMNSDDDSNIDLGICNLLKSCHGATKLSLVNVPRTDSMKAVINSYMNEYLALHISKSTSRVAKNVRTIEIEHSG